MPWHSRCRWEILPVLRINNQKRWIVSRKNLTTKPEIYHCISRIVDRGFLLEADEREHFRMLIWMCEKFTGCRVTI